MAFPISIYNIAYLEAARKNKAYISSAIPFSYQVISWIITQYMHYMPLFSIVTA